jgi:hypothetical protein
MPETESGKGFRHVVPFSSFHCYRRSDSVWAEQYTAPMEAYAEGFALDGSRLLPAFIRVDCETDEVETLQPPRADRMLRTPESCGDSWSDRLDAEDRRKLKHYFVIAGRRNSRGLTEFRKN